MVSYKCDRCTKEFKQKIDYHRHLNRKNLCKKSGVILECIICNRTYMNEHNLNRHNMKFHSSKIQCKEFLESSKKNSTSSNSNNHIHYSSVNNNNNMQEIGSNDSYKNSPPKHTDFGEIKSYTTKHTPITCNYCFQNFSRKDALTRHIQNRCKVKKEQKNNTLYLIQEMQEEIQQLKQQINNNMRDNGDINSHNIINVANNNTTNNIKLVAFGKEDLSYISDEVTKQILSHGCMAVPWLIKEAHYNDEHPTHQNVLLSNLRSNHVKIFNGTSWIAQDKKEILEKLYNTKNAHLQKKYKKFKDEIDNYAETKFQRFINTCEEEEVKKNVTKRIEQMMYNKRSLPIAQKEKLERDIRKVIEL